ncbi:MAG: hypothetical protein IJU64_04450 [Bacilli bacterium]|nr:hypothetical protein [Bacilli bacterium]
MSSSKRFPLLALVLASCAGSSALPPQTTPVAYDPADGETTPFDEDFYLHGENDEVLNSIRKSTFRPAWFTTDPEKKADRLLESSNSVEEAREHCRVNFSDDRFKDSINKPTRIEVEVETPFFYQVAVDWDVSSSSQTTSYSTRVICPKTAEFDYAPTAEWRNQVGHMRFQKYEHLQKTLDLLFSIPSASNWIASSLKFENGIYKYTYYYVGTTFASWWLPTHTGIFSATVAVDSSNGKVTFYGSTNQPLRNLEGLYTQPAGA